MNLHDIEIVRHMVIQLQESMDKARRPYVEGKLQGCYWPLYDAVLDTKITLSQLLARMVDEADRMDSYVSDQELK
jgi:hypothetical protein